MDKSIRFLSFLAVLSLAACAPPPTVREATVLASNAEKVHSLQFIYRNVEMKTVSSYSYGRGGNISGTGFHDFGSLLVKQAQPIFAERKVAVVAAQVMGGKDAIPVDRSPGEADAAASPTLVVAPVSGTVSGTTMSTVARYVFSAQLFDPRTRRLVWKATIDTGAWVGQDFVMKNFESKTYDDAYASKLLKAVADQMAQDGII